MLSLLFWAASAHAISRDEVIARAEAWVAANVEYSWDPWYTDPTSGECCYRTDCSGYVSAVWGLTPPGNTTYSFAGGVWDDGVSYVIDGADLQRGDALNSPGDPDAGTGHVMLYASGDYYSGYVEVYEEYGFGNVATHHWVYFDPGEYLPIRYTGIEDCAPEACDLMDNDCDGLVNEDYVCEIAAAPAFDASRHDSGTSTDVDGDGLADLCGRNADGYRCARAAGLGFVETEVLSYFSDTNGFNDFANSSTVRTADVNGDGLADVCGRHDTDGFRCFLSDGSRFGTVVQGPMMTDANGWADLSNYATLRMGDVNGDGKDDLCARGDVTFDCWLSDGVALNPSTYSVPLPDAYGMDQVQYYDTIRLADVNADALLDLCIRGPNGLACYLNNGSNFSTEVDGPGLADAYGWGQVQYYSTIEMPDINGDGRADACVRGPDRMYCWPSTGVGFGDTIEGPGLPDAYGWGSIQYYSTLRWADIDGDGADDLCARGADQMYCWRSLHTSFGDAIPGPPLSDAAGWTDHSNYATIALADLSGDGRADLCARGDSGMVCWLSDGASFTDQVVGPGWGDPQGWGSLEAYDTIAFAGGVVTSGADTAAGDTGGGTGDTGPDSGAPLGSPHGFGPPPTGCGCTGAGGHEQLAMLALAGLAAQRRRSRRAM